MCVFVFSPENTPTLFPSQNFLVWFGSVCLFVCLFVGKRKISPLSFNDYDDNDDDDDGKYNVEQREESINQSIKQTNKTKNLHPKIKMSSFCQDYQSFDHVGLNFNAQLLNNRAAKLITQGRYRLAISVLIQALKITEKINNDYGCYNAVEGEDNNDTLATCQCRCCSLGFCIGYSRQLRQNCRVQSSREEEEEEEEEGGTKTNEGQQVETDSRSILLSYQGKQHQHDVDVRDGAGNGSNDDENYCSYSEDNGCVYRNPIRIAPQSMTIEGHTMGLTLPLILTFNLALSHHLLYLQQKQEQEERRRMEQEEDEGDEEEEEAVLPNNSGLTVRKRKLQKILSLYELAYRWHMEDDDPQTDCVLFTMIISNNLAELHREAENYCKQKYCLQHLLSTLMFVVHALEEGQVSSSSSSSSGGGHGQTQPAAAEDYNKTVTSAEYDLFFRNTAQLTAHSISAGAA